MTVALLAKWGDQPPGTLYTSDVTTEATMVTAKVATATLTGAVAWVPPGSSPGSQGEPFTIAERSSLRILVAAPGSLATPMLIAKINQDVSRASVNAAGDNTFTTLASFVIPGGSMGPNGTMGWEVEIGLNNTAVAGGFKLMIGAVDISGEPGLAAGAANFYEFAHSFDNTAAAANRYRGSFVKQGASTSGFVTTTIDTAVDQTVLIVCRWAGAVAGGTITLRKARSWVEYGV